MENVAQPPLAEQSQNVLPPQPEPEHKQTGHRTLFLFFGVLFFLLIVAISVYFLFGTKFLQQVAPSVTGQTNTSSASITPTAPTSTPYTSPLGVSLLSPTAQNISEYDFSDFCSTVGERIHGTESGTQPTSKATAITIGPPNDISDIQITITRLDVIGSITPYVACAPGDLLSYRFFDKNDTLFTDVRDLISKKITPSQSHNFTDTGNAARFGVTAYTNETSHVSGITNFLLYGFAVPGLTLSKEYFLYDPNNQFILYITYRVTCPQEKLFQQTQDIASRGNTFKPAVYIKGMHDLAQSCDEVSSEKKVADNIISSLKFASN